MPCKLGSIPRGETRSVKHSISRQARYACVIEAHKSSRPRIGKAEPRGHDDLVAEKGSNSLNHCGMVRNPIPIPQAMKILDADAAVDKALQSDQRS